MRRELGPRTAKAVRDSLGTPGNDETVDGRDRCDVGGVEAEAATATVPENAYPASSGERAAETAWDAASALKCPLRAGRKDAPGEEPGKAENRLHRAVAGQRPEGNERKETQC